MEIQDNLTLFGVGATIVISAVSLFFSLKNHRKTLFINAITAARINWIHDLRKNMADFCGLQYHFMLSRLTEEEKAEIYQNLDKLSMLIKLQLNRYAKFDSMIIEKVDAIMENMIEDRIEDERKKDLKELTNFTQDLLKMEWERVKLESKSGILGDKEKKELTEKYLKSE